MELASMESSGEPAVSVPLSSGAAAPPFAVPQQQQVVMAKRPGYGSAGQPISLLANHYRVRFQPKDIFHYDVTITPEPPKGFNHKIITETFKQHAETLGNAMPAYDGQKSLFTAKELAGQLTELDVVFTDDDSGAAPRRRGRTFRVVFRQASKFNLRQMSRYLAGEPIPLPHEALQVIDIVLRQAQTRFFAQKGRSFYGVRFGAEKLQGGLVACNGFFQSVRPAQSNLLTLNIDIASAPFYDTVDLPTFIGNAFRTDPRELNSVFSRNDSVGDRERTRLKKFLKGLRVETTHTKHQYRIKSLTDVPLDVLTFDSNGEELSVADYFRNQYTISLGLRGFPAIEAGNKERKRYIPIEICRIVKDQPYMKALNEAQRSGLLKQTCLPPQERKERTRVIGEEVRNGTMKEAMEFGIEINKFMTEVPGRVLPAPRIMYKSAQENPREGAWNMRGKTIWNGSKINSWAMVNFGSVAPHAVENFCTKLPELCTLYGMLMNPKMAVPVATERRGNVEGVVKYLMDTAERNTQPLQLIICIMPRTDNKSLYAAVKRVCELELGVWTQCCLEDHVTKCKPEYIANVILKINAKLGGQNSLLFDEQQKSLPLISEVPSLIIGADISHSRIGESNSPSICAVAASMDWPNFSRYEAIVRSQRRGTEELDDLYWEKVDEQGRKQTGGIFKDLLCSFQERCNRKPERILYYRDGVSDGQFEKILNNEYGALKKTFEALGWTEQSQMLPDEGPSYKKPRLGKSPQVTFIVVQKRHHTRFFPNIEKRCPTLRNGNVLPGTVVDTVISQPKLFDFFLCSHAGIKGTSKPTHYNVLKDENGFSADSIQRLTNDLCFTYARCTRSVSIVPPCYYAHLAAKRARVWLDSESSSDGGSFQGRSLSGGSGSQNFPGPSLRPLPPVHARIKDSMFFI